jgi:hypothetical protein
VNVAVAPCIIGLFVGPVIVGAEVTVKVAELVVVPPAAVSEIVPVVPEPTVAVTCVALTTVIPVQAVPPTETAVVPVKLVPLIVINCEPAQPLVGVKLVMVGGVGQVLLIVNVPVTVEVVDHCAIYT